MTLTGIPAVLQNSSHPAQLFREAYSSLISPGGGIVQPGDFTVAQNGVANMSVNVGAGRIWVPSTFTATVNPGGGAYYPGGHYYAESDATVNLPISASNVTNPRIDTVICQVQDAAYSGATNSAQLAVLTGTPTSGATLVNLNGAASVPASSLVLGYVLVPANATSIITADLANVAAQLVGAAALGTGRALTIKSFTDGPIIGAAGTVTAFAPSGGANLFPTACLDVFGCTGWYTTQGGSTPSTSAGWIRYYPSSRSVLFDAGNATGGNVFPVTIVLALGY